MKCLTPRQSLATMKFAADYPEAKDVLLWDRLLQVSEVSVKGEIV